MESMNFPANIRKCLLALGPESEGNFSVFYQKVLYRSDSFGDLLNEENFQKFKGTVLNYFKKNKLRPDVIITDLHPLYKTTLWGEQLSKKYEAKHIKTQHHIAHIFSAVGDRLIQNSKFKIQNYFLGIACDGTGYGTDGKIWGGEIFKVQSSKLKVKSIERIGHLENQTLIGGDLAVKEPARMLISALSKFLPEDETYLFVKRYYSKNKFEVLSSQLKQNFNCQETSSAGRVLDAVSILLGFSGNERKVKHGPAIALENNSTKPYPIKPKMIYDKEEKQYILRTTPLFEYLVKNIRKDKRRLAATAQLYIAKGLFEVVLKANEAKKPKAIFFAGGIANNKIISDFLGSKVVYASKKIYPVKSARGAFNRVPRGDVGISFGQIVHYLLTNPRH